MKSLPVVMPNRYWTLLYERLILGALTADVYKAKKTAVENELNHLNKVYTSLKSETTVMMASKSSDDEIRRLAENVSAEGKLTKALVELLIDRVYVFPDSRVDVEWKVADFASLEAKRNQI